jgi:uncharacterized protein (DUF1800 family)
MWSEKHDFGAKTLLKGFTIPARAPTAENGVRDVDDALRNLFEHPNTGPFIGRQLIQFLVTSNPSSNYVARVAAKFANNGAGKRGDLAAVVRAILLDEEARDARWFVGAAEFGRLKEPVHRALAIARAGRLDNYTNLLWWTWGEFNSAAFQEPGYSPSVFNFFRPGYQPPGLLTANGLHDFVSEQALGNHADGPDALQRLRLRAGLRGLAAGGGQCRRTRGSSRRVVLWWFVVGGDAR